MFGLNKGRLKIWFMVLDLDLVVREKKLSLFVNFEF